MSYFVRRWWGADEREMPPEQFVEVIEQMLKDGDEEHGSVSLTHESEWNLSYSLGRTLILVKVDSRDRADRFHQHQVSTDYVLRMWNLLAKGNLELIRKEPWKPGYY
jgi:hypothetical protein